MTFDDMETGDLDRLVARALLERVVRDVSAAIDVIAHSQQSRALAASLMTLANSDRLHDDRHAALIKLVANARIALQALRREMEATSSALVEQAKEEDAA